MRLHRYLWRLVGVMACGIVLLLGAVLLAGHWLSRPAQRVVGAPPQDLAATTIRIPWEAHNFVVGWWIRGRPGTGAVLLLHGVRGDRAQMLDRARFLRAAGYAVLLIDLQAHGESPGTRISFGAREAAGVRAALAFLRRELPQERVGVIGVSLGAAALVLSRPEPAPDAVVLESMYPTIGEAVEDRLRMRIGRFAPLVSQLLLWPLPWLVGVAEDELRPIDALTHLRSPVLIASGTQDRHTSWAETERLYAAASSPKTLWAVEGAAHVDLHRFAPQSYEGRVLAFLAAGARQPR